MFKRVEKKLAKKKKDEELGFSEEIKEAIGLIDSDSDDSSSDESEASSSTSNLPVPSKRKRLLDDGLDASSDVNSEGQGSGAADDPEDYEDEPGVQMSVEEALHDPLYIISIQPDIRGCIICPRKLLKNNTMTSVHMKSQAHQRRISKFKEAAASAKPDDDAQCILSIALASTPLEPKRSSSSLSNRAAKRIAKFEKMKAKRQKHKAGKARSMAANAAKKLKAKADSESETSNIVPSIEPLKKKPKLERLSSPGKLVEQNSPSVKQKSDDRPDGDPLRRQPRRSKESQTTDAKTNTKSKLTDKKKRKEVTSHFTPALVVSRR